jgi:hypothetical protein
MSLRYPGGLITKSPTAPTSSAAKGVWTLEQALQYIKAGTWPLSLLGDPYFQYNTMLLPGQGTNNTQNNSFLDSSGNGYNPSRSGETTQGTFTPFSGANGNWSNYFDGNGDFLTCPNNAAFDFASGDVTLEAWVYFNAISSQTVVAAFATGGTGFTAWSFSINSSGYLLMDTWVGGTEQFITATSNPVAANQWTHIAYTRASGTSRLFVNGASCSFSGSISQGINSGGNLTSIASSRYSGFEGYLNGYISNCRVVKGVAVYTGNFTPPTAPLTAISGTSLLTCQSNRFVDNSTNAFTLTSNGNAAVTPFQPFGAPTSAYSAATNGGSGYFDGSGDYLDAGAQTAFAFGTGSWTVEAWVYVNSLASEILLFDTRSGASTAGVGCRIATDGTLSYSGSANNALTTSAIKVNEWNHIAWSYDGTTLSGYINGSRGGTATPSFNISQNNGVVGRVGFSAAGYMNGYIGGLRVVKGTAVYSGTSFTVPTAPLTAITNTSLLLNFTNAGIIDNAQDNDLITFADAKISTAQFKWGTSSISFDGTGDYLIPSSSTTNLQAFGTGDFTIEFWFYSNNSGSQQMLYDSRPASTNGNYISLYKSSSNVLELYVNSATRITGTATIAANTWYHVALSRTGGGTKLYVNGNQTGSTYADTTNYLNASNRPVIASDGATLGNIPLNGYIQDLRITKGYARYPYNFTAPTAALPLFYQAAATPSSDPYFDYTTLLLPGNGTNGAQNNTFLDSSTNAFTITRNGNTTQGTFTPFSQTGWSNNFNGSSTFSAASNSAFNILAYDTFECWVNMSVLGTSDLIAGRDGNYWLGYNHTSINGAANKFVFAIWNGSSWQAVSSATTPSVGLWYHVMGVKDNTTLRIYINGVQENTASFSGTPITTGTFYVASNNNTENLEGYVSNLRLVTGASSTVFPYSGLTTGSSFSVPTSSLTAVTGTALLTCQSNRFVDNSTNAFALTVAGSPTVQAFSPFNPTASYSAATVGGSGYFDGTGDYLTYPPSTSNQFGTGSFTIEAWYYPFSAPTGAAAAYIYDARNASVTSTWILGCRLNGSGAGNLLGWYNGSATLEGSALTLNAWNHVVYVRNSSTNTGSLFLNGTRTATQTDTTNYSSTGATATIGSRYNNTDLLYGYLQDLRVVKGTAVYDASATSITVPTAPLTAITNTSLLLSGTNGGIIDNTAKNNLETVGNASISTTVSKFGGSSMLL